MSAEEFESTFSDSDPVPSIVSSIFSSQDTESTNEVTEEESEVNVVKEISIVVCITIIISVVLGVLLILKFLSHTLDSSLNNDEIVHGNSLFTFNIDSRTSDSPTTVSTGYIDKYFCAGFCQPAMFSSFLGSNPGLLDRHHNKLLKIWNKRVKSVEEDDDDQWEEPTRELATAALYEEFDKYDEKCLSRVLTKNTEYEYGSQKKAEESFLEEMVRYCAKTAKIMDSSEGHEYQGMCEPLVVECSVGAREEKYEREQDGFIWEFGDGSSE